MMESQPHAILEVRWGKLGSHKAILSSGQTLRVGRSELADLVIPHDPLISSVHFQLSWDGKQCRLRDLESLKGTLLGGEPVTDAVVPHGGWIRAGETNFSLYIEGHTPARTVDPDDLTPEDIEHEKKRQTAAAQALTGLKDESTKGTLYAVLDAARDDRILELVQESVEDYRSLYEGVQGETMAHVAPYLVKMSEGSRLLTALVQEGWGKRWGVYLSCPLSFKEVRTHLRRFLMVEEEETGEKLYFRFYDPWVLRIFLPTCAERQKQQFFGDIEAFLFEGEEFDLIRRLANGSDNVQEAS